ncbi:MAG: gliding motility-associated C-terminal domain-containing protein, partial [Bacteroidales bacterium]|nr:gliding motility-associated C-terminal domain-containing protein [Bacteroidales bacterium]
QSGHYTVTASIGDCRATASTDIPPCDLEVYLPNAITPSRSDGLNDCLRLPEPLIHKTSDFSLSIYNRWGEQVFVTDDPHFIWCGETARLSDVYVYLLRLKDQNGKPFVYRGFITVL